jgi:hypothetical protein
MAVPQVPQQGDAARLQQLSSGLKKEHGTYGAVVQRTQPGRPAGTTGTPAPRASQAQQDASVDPAHLPVMQQAAQAEASRQFWTQWAQQFPGPNADYYLQQAEAMAQQAHESLYSATPNFLEE